MKAVHVRVFLEQVSVIGTAKCTIRLPQIWGVWCPRDFLAVECIRFIDRWILKVGRMFVRDWLVVQVCGSSFWKCSIFQLVETLFGCKFVVLK